MSNLARKAYPLSPITQQDVDEFMITLFDKMEAFLVGTPEASLFSRLFGGTTMNQIISKECPHLSEREENFVQLGVEVKGV